MALWLPLFLNSLMRDSLNERRCSLISLPNLISRGLEHRNWFLPIEPLALPQALPFRACPKIIGPQERAHNPQIDSIHIIEVSP